MKELQITEFDSVYGAYRTSNRPTTASIHRPGVYIAGRSIDQFSTTSDINYDVTDKSSRFIE